MKVYLSDTDGKDLSQPHFDDEPGIQERQEVKDQQSYIFNSVVYLTVQIHGSSISSKVAW